MNGSTDKIWAKVNSIAETVCGIAAELKIITTGLQDIRENFRTKEACKERKDRLESEFITLHKKAKDAKETAEEAHDAVNALAVKNSGKLEQYAKEALKAAAVIIGTLAAAGKL